MATQEDLRDAVDAALLPVTGGPRLALRIGLVGIPVALVGAVLAFVLVAGSMTVRGGSSSADGSTTCTNGDVAASPGASGPPAAVPGLDVDQLRNAGTISAVGRELGVPARGLVVALATALQESTLRNLPYGDRDSLGLFQQRAAWGTVAERTDPATSARLFFSGGRAGQPGLLDIAGWEAMTVTRAAQAVQRSAFPDAYAKWELTATRLLGAAVVTAVDCVVDRVSPLGRSVVAAATRWLGTPYSWGGGDLSGPSEGFAQGAGIVGFDCSSLSRYAWYVATGGKVLLPRVSTDQAASLPMLPRGTPLAPGDLMFFHDPADPPGVYHHVGIYAGSGAMVHAPHTGATVSVVKDVLSVPYYKAQFAGAVRPGAA